jgi:hypothetical protein
MVRSGFSSDRGMKDIRRGPIFSDNELELRPDQRRLTLRLSACLTVPGITGWLLTVQYYFLDVMHQIYSLRKGWAARYLYAGGRPKRP